MPRLLLLMSSRTYRAEAFLAAARTIPGLELSVGTDRKQVLERSNPAGNVTLDFARPERGAEQAVRYSARFPLDRILAVDDDGALLAALAARTLGIPGNAPEAVATARDKSRMRSVVRSGGLPAPSFRVVRWADEAALERAGEEVSYPLVVKPLNLSASRGVIRANDRVELLAAAARTGRLLTDPEVAREAGESCDRVLVESFVEGPELSVDGMLRDGQVESHALFDKPDPLDGPFFEETMLVAPSSLSDEERRRVIEAAERGAAAIGLVRGPIHAEVRAVHGAPVLIEIAPRSIGGRCSSAIRFEGGVSLEELILRRELDLPGEAPRRDDEPSGVMMLPIPRTGVLEQVLGQEAALAVDGVTGISITAPSGMWVCPPPEGGRYLGFVFARAPTREAVVQALRSAHARLEIRYRDAGGGAAGGRHAR